MNCNQHATSNKLPERIRARVFEGALSRVTRMYAAGLADVFTETLQNSRRAGATRGPRHHRRLRGNARRPVGHLSR